MGEVEAYFSRLELRQFLKDLADQVETGKVSIEIPGYSKGKAKIDPKQPIDLVFDKDDEKRDLTIKIKFEDRRDL